MKVLFSPPDIGEKEIEEVIDALRSGWITTGPKTKKFEEKITAYCNTDKTVCLNSATAALELSLRVLGIGKGDDHIYPGSSCLFYSFYIFLGYLTFVVEKCSVKI